MRHFPLRELGYAVGFIVCLLVVYLGSYCLVVTPSYKLVPGKLVPGATPGHIAPVKGARYRWVPQDVGDLIFAPGMEIDAWIRPDEWSLAAARRRCFEEFKEDYKKVYGTAYVP